MESLHHAVGLRVVGGRTGSLGCQQISECLPQVGLELFATISDERGGNTEVGNPARDEGSSD